MRKLETGKESEKGGMDERCQPILHGKHWEPKELGKSEQKLRCPCKGQFLGVGHWLLGRSQGLETPFTTEEGAKGLKSKDFCERSYMF